MGDEATAPLIRHCFETKTPLGQALHRKVMNDFRQYVLVGGLPQSVLAYQDGKNFAASDEATVVNACFNTTDPGVGLALSANHATQQCYMADTGLLVTLAFMDTPFTDNELYRAVLFDRLDINEGMIMENIVAQMLRRNGHRLCFYSRSDNLHRENHMEIDFLITEGKKISSIEVKSGNYRSHSSLDKFRRRFGAKIGTPYILYPKDVMEKDGIWHLLLYMGIVL